MVKKQLVVAVPASMISDTPHLREKTSKVGFIGRAAAIFRVDEIVVYRDNVKINQNQDMDLIATLLNYMETPQYLRKRLFELKPELQYAGIMPPLRTPHHPLNWRTKDLKVGEFREGVLVSKARDGMLIDIGVERPALIRGKVDAFVLNKRAAVKIVNVAEPVEVQIVNCEEIPTYWGYKVSVERRSLKNLLDNGKFDLTVGTSKFADGFQQVAERMGEKWSRANRVLVAFGAPSRGLHEIARDEGANVNDLFDFMINTVPGQGTETVRTEEAFLASLAILNMQFVH